MSDCVYIMLNDMNTLSALGMLPKEAIILLNHVQK